MKKLTWFFLALYFLIQGPVACTTRILDVESERSFQEISQLLDEIRQVSANSIGPSAFDEIDSWLAQDGAVIYFAEAPGPMGEPWNVAPLHASLTGGKTSEQLEFIRTYFILLPLDIGYLGAFIVHYKPQGADQSEVHIFMNNDITQPGSDNEGEFLITMKNVINPNDVLLFQSFDYGFYSLDLSDNIQIELFAPPQGASTEDFYMGKVSAMQGFFIENNSF